jgi:cytochrome o ubiquinol oxidase operon protein cyoD
MADTHAAGDTAHGNLKSYTTGFALSLGLTVLSFGAVMVGVLPQSLALTMIVLLAVAQLLVQLIYFLHLGTSPDQRANSAIFAVTGFLIVIIVGLSLWVMHNANVNMMPTTMSVDRAMSKD